MASSQDACYISLLGLAEYFRTANPPNIKKCIQSLQALFTFKPPLKVEARTHLQMGQVLMAYTKNVELARNHLEQAVRLRLFFFFPLSRSRRVHVVCIRVTMAPTRINYKFVIFFRFDCSGCCPSR